MWSRTHEAREGGGYLPRVRTPELRTEVLGRTNAAFPRVWLSLSVPHGGFDTFSPADLAHAARETGLPIDISTQPALWGGPLRGGGDTLVTFGGRFLATAHDERNALELTQAHLIETLSSIGRETIDVYALTVRRPLEEWQINGALEALESARQEGHIRHFGIHAEGSGLAALGLWQFHDFAELLFLPQNPLETEAYANLAPLAAERRVGIVTTRPLEWATGDSAGHLANRLGLASEAEASRDLLALAARAHPILVTVRTPGEIVSARAALDGSGLEPPYLRELIRAYDAVPKA